MTEPETMTNGAILTTGGIGTGASLAAWLVSHAAQINPLLQMGTLALGLIIAAVTLYKLVRKK